MVEVAGVVAAALVGGWLGQRLALPGGTIIGALAAVAALGLVAGWRVAPPEPLRLGAFVVVGVLLGESFDADTRTSLRRAAAPMAAAVIAMAAAVAALAWALHAAFGLGVVTALLAATPGGLANMVAVALSIGSSDPLAVGTAHLVRVLVVVTAMPLVLRWTQHRQGSG